MSDPFTGLSFKVGVAENKNTTYRNKMEDVHTYIANFAERVDWGYFAIFDGHAGKDTARWCGNNLHQLVEKEIDVNETLLAPMMGKHDMRDSLCRAFLAADEGIEKDGVGTLGCTAAVAVLRWETDPSINQATLSTVEKHPAYEFTPQSFHKRVLYTLNVGDSRIVICRNGEPFRLSYDHKASDMHEINRIRDQGGLIMKNRVNGVLAVTRSLGDSYMKDLVIGRPFTTKTPLSKDDEFMILACDGVWDVILDIKACQFVQEQFSITDDTLVVAKKLCQLAMDLSTTDNVTVMVVKFDKGVFGDD